MKTEVKEKLRFKNYLIFLIGYFSFILMSHFILIITLQFPLDDYIWLIALLFVLIIFTLYALGDLNLKKDKLILNQDKSSWSNVKTYNIITWLLSFMVFANFIGEDNYLNARVVVFSLLTLLSVVLSNLSFSKIYPKEAGLKFFFVKISLLTVFAGALTFFAYTSLFGIFTVISDLFS